MKIGKIPDQVVRIVIIFGIGLIALVTVRYKFIPDTFGDIGHYRAAAIGANADKPVRYAGWQICNDCHEEEVAKKNSSYHRALSCEGCHGPAYEHAEIDFDEYTPVIPRDSKTCLRCHAYLPSRPTGFPQIIELQHHPAKACVKCHDPHDPTPPETPDDCAGCHGQIARSKAISHHALVDCRICHEAPDEHMTNPRNSLPSKPRDREFCGKCHGEEAKPLTILVGTDLRDRDVPRIDLAEHGNSYVCWQCHYPHFPEAQ